MPAHFENDEKCDGSKIWAFTRCRNNLKTVGNLTIRNSLQDFDAKKCSYTLTINQSRFISVEKCSVFIIFKWSQNVVSKMYRLELHFQNLPFSKSAGKKCAVFVWTGGLSVEFFTVFKMCRHHVNAALNEGQNKIVWKSRFWYAGFSVDVGVLVTVVVITHVQVHSFFTFHYLLPTNTQQNTI